MEEVYRGFEGAAHVSTLASLGFGLEAPKSHTPHATFTLQQQVHHKAAFINEHCLQQHDLPVVVVGHSIGHYMAMRAVNALECAAASSSSEDGVLSHARLRYGCLLVV
jgi:alpha-beta hydrolase superfamily lysophospholipase